MIAIFDLETGDIKVLPRKSNTSTGMSEDLVRKITQLNYRG